MRSFFLFICFSFLCSNVLAQTFADPNFAAIPIGSGWNSPTGATFSKDGQKLFVWERGGKLYVCNRDGAGNYIKQIQPVIDLTAEVANWDAHGMLGFALDPNFASNGLIYLLYPVNRNYLLYFGTPSYDPLANGTNNATIGRVTRYQTITSGGNLVANPSTRKILIGETKQTGMPILHHSHGVGSLAFAADGSLLVTIGDAASYEGVDAGSDPGTFYQQALIDGIIRPAENVGAFRAQLVNSMSGKLLRIDPQTGDGLPSNPFYSVGQPRAPKSRVWALGLRNSFRIHIKPGTGSSDPALGDIGEVYLGDVGFASWEEMDVVKAPGMNFGWPIYEGNEYTIPLDGVGLTYKDLNIQNLDEPNPLNGTGGCTQPYFYFRQLIKQATPDDNKTIYNPCNTSQPIGTGNRYYHRRPALEWSHAHPWARVGIFNGNTPDVAMIGSPESQVVGTPFPGQCSVGGALYTGNTYPSQYKNTYFQADFGAGWIKRISLDFTDVVTRVDDFATGFTEIVCITQNPLDGTLITVQLASTTGVKKIVYGGNQPPVAKLAANVTYGSSPLSVNFTGSNSFDASPGGSIVSYSWNFGGGSPATSNVANPGNIVFTESSGNPKKFVVRLTVTDNGGATNTDSIIISVNNTPPVVNITSPIKNSLYKQGLDTLYACTATVTDAQHGPAQLKYEWQTTLRHNNHEHREAIDNAVNTSTLIQRVGFYGSDVYYWLIELKVTDAAGLSAKDSAKIFPDRSATDNTPPTVSSVSPVNGATGVNIGTTVTANFNEAINASTVTGTTFQIKDAGNNIIPATINTSSNQITLTPSAALINSATYTVTIKGGASGVKDLAGNALVNDFSWTFTTMANSGGTLYTVFQSTDLPEVPLANDEQGIVLGMKFQSTQNGFITGIRYYKGAGATGTHTGHLWSNTGTLLATATFTGETSSGWQQALFGSPVAITAGVTYVTSYFSPSGDYAATNPYFTQAVVNGPLRALANGEDGPNGLYKYSSTSVFPNSNFQSSNYWVDVVFKAVEAPTVTTQPSSQTKCAGSNASFNSTANGNPGPSVQWQVSANGVSWTNINGANNSVLTFATTIADNNKQYRAVWTNSGGSVNSNPATLTVNPIPASPVITVVNNCGNSILTAGSFTGSLLWSNGKTTSSIIVTTAGTYTVKQTVNGCTSAAGSGTAAPQVIPQLSGSLAAAATSGTMFTYTAASTIAGTIFAWNRTAVTGVSNAAANGTGNISETLVNTTSSPVNVTYVYTLTANSCTSTQNVVITVNPVTTVNCTINNTSLTSNFSSTAIPAGKYIWFNSSFDPGSLGTGTDPVTMNITNGVISFTANSVQYTLSVPNSRIRFDNTVTSASTQFINNVWETVVPRSYTSDIFMGGLSYLVPVNFPGNYINVKWTTNISIDKAGISLSWRWAAAVYTTFAGHSGINVKPINGSTQNPYANSDRAGTPENFKSFVVSGAKGTGGTNYTGSFSGTSSAICTTASGQRSSLLTSKVLSIEPESKLEVNVIPNASNTFFNLVIKGNNENPVAVRVFDIVGQVMERHEKIASNSTLRIGQKWASGSYFVEVIQDDQRKFVKIIKVN